MTQPPGCTMCCPADDVYCDRWDLLVGLSGLHVSGVERDPGGLQITDEPENYRPRVLLSGGGLTAPPPQA